MPKFHLHTFLFTLHLPHIIVLYFLLDPHPFLLPDPLVSGYLIHVHKKVPLCRERSVGGDLSHKHNFTVNLAKNVERRGKEEVIFQNFGFTTVLSIF